jgi:hypothetical protein
LGLRKKEMEFGGDLGGNWKEIEHNFLLGFDFGV